MRERRFPEGRRSDRAQGMTARTEPALSGTVPFLHSHPRVWIFDMDDTLLASSAGILDEVHVLMNDFLIRRMGFSREKANFLREYYWRTYGSTFIGLWRCHGVDPRVFLPAVHDFDYAPYLTGLKSMRAVLSKFPGRRVLMTNGPRNYADAILPAIGLKGFFDLEVTSSDMRLFGDWRPKPSVAMMKALAARLGRKVPGCSSGRRQSSQPQSSEARRNADRLVHRHETPPCRPAHALECADGSSCHRSRCLQC